MNHKSNWKSTVPGGGWGMHCAVKWPPRWSPPLTWSNVPAGTREFALVLEDPDAGNPPPFVHWVIYNIPATAKGLPENVPFEPDMPMPTGALHSLLPFE